MRLTPGAAFVIQWPELYKKITILDRKDQDLFIDLNLLHDLDQFIDLLELILIFDL